LPFRLEDVVPPFSLRNVHIPMADYSTPTEAQIELFVSEVNKELAERRSAVAHCQMGYGRTGTMLACYLIAEQAMPPLAAVSLVRQKRPGSIAKTQEEFLFLYWKYMLPLRKQQK